MTDDIVKRLWRIADTFSTDNDLSDITIAANYIVELRAALEKLIAACDAGRRYEKGIGGMTIAAQLARTVIYGVSASAVEDARDALVEENTND